MVLSESVDTKLPNLKRKFLTAFKNKKYDDCLVSNLIVEGGGFITMRSQAPEVVEKLVFMLNPVGWAILERLFISTLTPEKLRRWQANTLHRYSRVHIGYVYLILKLTFLNYYTSYVYYTNSGFNSLCFVFF